MLKHQIRLSPVLTIGPQVDEEKLEKLADSGFSTIVNLTRKGEFEQVLTPVEEGEIVESLGMDYLHLPTTLSRFRIADMDTICQELSRQEAPIYLHCRIGQRASLVGLSFHGLRRNFTRETVLARAREAGIRWRAPYLREFLNKYIQRTRAIREEIGFA